MQSIKMHNCFRDHIEFENGYDSWMIQYDPQKTPTPMNLNTISTLNNMNYVENMVDNIFFGSSSASSSGVTNNSLDYARILSELKDMQF